MDTKAEFGGATGGVINVVTKRGSNEFHGDVGAAFDTSKLDAGPRQDPERERVASSVCSESIYLSEEGQQPYFLAVVHGRWSDPQESPFLFRESLSAVRRYNERLHIFRWGMRSYRTKVQNDYSFCETGRTESRTSSRSVPIISTTRCKCWEFSRPSLLSTEPAPRRRQQHHRARLRQDSAGVNRQQISAFREPYTPTQNLSIGVRFGRGYLNEKLNNYGIPQATNYVCGDYPCLLGNAGARLFATNSPTVKDISIATAST
jgi:hypothetical protein